MLVITRKIGETIKMGDGIEVKVTAIKGNRVLLSVAADKSVRVERAEKFDWRNYSKENNEMR